jgi:magnesium chelatase family protein
MALRRLSLTPGQWGHILQVARAIANLDASDILKARHIAEAVQYRADATIFRPERIGQ